MLSLFKILYGFFDSIDLNNSLSVKDAVPNFFTTILAPILAK